MLDFLLHPTLHNQADISTSKSNEKCNKCRVCFKKNMYNHFEQESNSKQVIFYCVFILH